MAQSRSPIVSARPERRVSDLRVVGLCARCAYARRVTTARGSLFWLCQRSEADPRFRKYPTLPVRRCPGFEAESAPPGSDARDPS